MSKDLIIFFILELSILCLFFFIPVFRGGTTLFGVKINREAFENPGLKILKRYRLILIALFLGLGGSGLIHSYFNGRILYAILGYVFSMIASLFVYAQSVRELWQFREVLSETRFASSLKPRNVSDYTILPLELLIITFIVAPFFILLYYYPQLPASFPVHFNAAGEADDWIKKSFVAVFFWIFFSAYMQVWLFILKKDMTQVKLNAPASQAEKYLFFKEQKLAINLYIIDWARVSITLLFAIISLLPLSPLNPFLQTSLVTGLWLTAVALIGGISFYLYKLVRVNRQMDKELGDANPMKANEAEGWNSGLFYSNKNDPALFVEKIEGMGFTINFANKRWLIHLAFIIGMEVLIFGFIFFFRGK